MNKQLCAICICLGLVCAGWSTEAAVPPLSDESTVTTGTDDPGTQTEITAAPETVAESESATEQTASSPVLAEQPAVSDATPDVPSGEKIITFYPEPESLVIVPDPAKTSATAAKQADSEKAASGGTVPKADTTGKTAAQVSATNAVLPTGISAAKTDGKASEPAASKAEAEVLPGIWESEAVAPSVPAVAAKSATAPSRSVEMFVGQTLEVWYPATGWVFLGDASAQNGLGYQTRKMDKSDTLFTFRAVKAGNYILEFSRYDVLTDSFAQDSLAVAVAPSTSSIVKKDKVRAPDYKNPNTPSTGTATPAGGMVSGSASTVSASSASALSTTAAATSTVSSSVLPNVAASATGASADPLADMLDKAKKAVAAGDAATALALLDSYLASATSSIDEGLYLRGQAYEQNGASRNVKKALESYEALVASWPESIHWKDADARIRYIHQFYLRVR